MASAFAPARQGAQRISTTRLFSVGRLTARIVPSSKLDYELQKPPHTPYETNNSVDLLWRQIDAAVLTEQSSAKINADETKTSDDAVTSIADDDDLTILLHAVVPSPPSKQVKSAAEEGQLLHFHSSRHSNESAEKGLKRMTTNFMAKFHAPPSTVPRGKKRKSKQAAAKRIPLSKLPTITRRWRVDKEEVVEIKGRSNMELWRDLADDSSSSTTISFPIPLDLELISCPPTVFSVETFGRFDRCVFVGVPLHVDVQVIHANRIPRVAWFVNGKIVQQPADEHQQYTYTPTADDVGHRVQVVVSPGGGPETAESYDFVHAVEAIPFMPVVQSLRHEWTNTRTDDTHLRVVTYNLLADQYAKKENTIMDHCPPSVLDRNRRMPLLLYELLSYRADILCLQEVDGHIFHTLYKPVLESQGYQGFFSSKLSGQQEGCAMFWLDSKLICKEQMEVGIKDLLLDISEDDLLHWKEHLPLLEELPRIKGRIQDLGQIVQCATFQRKHDIDAAAVVVANTHLYYHPLGDHLRALQTYGVCRLLGERTASQEAVGLILCGDLNSDPKSGSIQLLQERQVDAFHDSAWENLLLHPRPRTLPSRDQQESTLEEEANPPTLTLPATFPILTSSSGNDDVAVFTHCIPQFCATLDYIVSSLPCVARAPNPTTPTFMPNEGMPSDHISLVADFDMSGGGTAAQVDGA